MPTSPLRYPGGKAKLYPYFVELIRTNQLFGREYCEPYAGGAGLAIRLLTTGFVDRIVLNDIDPAIFAFWNAVLRNTEEFVQRLRSVPINIEEWRAQKEIWSQGDAGDSLALGFATYYLNRTSRSGILEGAGPIGGYEQTGNWRLDARLSKENQIQNILELARYAPQIELSCEDALPLIRRRIKSKKTIVYMDPPYYVKGSKLYKNFYAHEDHARIASVLERAREGTWVLSYDDVASVREMYRAFTPISYSLQYSAGKRASGREVIYLSDGLGRPTLNGFDLAA